MTKRDNKPVGGQTAASLREQSSPWAAWRVSLSFLLRFFLACLLVFAVGKVFFMCYNRSVEAFSAHDVWDVWRHGLSMDVSTCCYLLVLPWLVMLVWQMWHRMPVRWILVPYSLLVAVLLGLIIGGDAVLYEFWKFKLNATVFSYIHNPEGATASVSLPFLISRVGGIVLAILLIALLLLQAVRGGLPAPRVRQKGRAWASFVLLLLAPVIFLGIRGSIGTSVMNLGVPYFSQRLFLNHAAVNPAFSLLSSFKRAKNYAEEFDWLPEAERAETFAPLYPQDTEDVTDTLLCTSRPNILVVLMESFGGKFVAELGGIPDVAPNMSRLIPQGVFWEQFYANSFRTDRGTVSVFSGWVSYPTASLMRLPDKLAGIPSLAQSLQREGYTTGYLYGGDIRIMGKRGYLVGAGYQDFISDRDFPFSAVHESKWGVNDSIAARRMFEWIASKPASERWHLVFQTLSSHEPFEVPYHRLADKKLNAFAFTDHCVGALVDSLQTLPAWDDMLVILLPDHGYLYDLTYEDPAFFHCPMLWLGGALRQPRRIQTLLNQSDLVATLLSQLGISHTEFPWSRNVLSRAYTYPFVYSNFPGGILFRDSTGVSVYDITSRRPITEQPSPSAERLQKAKAILQTSYDQLGTR